MGSQRVWCGFRTKLQWFTARHLWVIGVLLACALVNPYVRGDGNGYYAWLVSPVIDGDVDFTNQFRRGDPAFQSFFFAPGGEIRDQRRTPTGHLLNHWSVGPAVLWAPWFLTAHAGVLTARALGSSLPADGYSWPYLWLVSIGTVVYGSLALWLSGGIARRLGYQRGVTWAVAGIALASSLPVYQVFVPFHVHALAAFSTAAFVAYWSRYPHMPGVRHWVCWGALGGLMVEVYQINGAFLVAAVWLWFTAAWRCGVGGALARGAAFVVAATVVLIPQFIGKWLLYGHALKTGYRAAEFDFSDTRFWAVLWSPNHGWLLWTPIVIIALIGLVHAARTHALLRPLLGTVIVFYVAIAGYINWHGQSAFGGRFFVSLTVLLVIGLAAAVDWSRDRPRAVQRTLSALVVVLIGWNAGFMFQWGTNIIPNLGPVSFAQVAINQVTVVPAALTTFLRGYFSDRRGTQREVEAEDYRQRDSHQIVR